MFDRFWRDHSGAYAIAFTVALVPIMGGLALGIDYAELNRQQQATLNALDAAGIATARQVVTGATDEELVAYANNFFDANLGPVDPATTTLSVTLPKTDNGGGTLTLCAALDYKPYFLPVFRTLLEGVASNETVGFQPCTEVRLKNTLEVALALDNSGSMNYYGSGSGEKRIDLLKAAAKQLVETLANQAALVKQVDKPVQFGLVPFAASVNVGPQNAGQPWMDTWGVSPIHHENFDWTTVNEPDRWTEKVDGVWYKRGVGWGAEENAVLSRFSLYRDMKQVDTREWVATGREWVCTSYRSDGTCRSGQWEQTGYYEETVDTYASWQGCVEARPYPYNVNDAPPAGAPGGPGGDPATLFVPMFAPDEPGDRWATADDATPDNLGAANNWWNDGTEATSGRTRQQNMMKYFETRPYGATSPHGTGPNYGCTTRPITPLTDVTAVDGLQSVETAIDAMEPNGGTDVPEGMAWGWRVVSGGPPFTEGRDDGEKGNDKVIIVLTDGANTYYTPSSLGYSDPAGNRSIYSAYGYVGKGYDGGGTTRLFMGTDGSGIGLYDYSNSNYTAALNTQMSTLCSNAKAAGVIVMTVGLDLDASDASQADAISALRQCASESRFRKDPNNPGVPAKLFWNATGASLIDDFKDIANELSNLRIIG